jgi:uncharacterized protein
LTSGAGTGNGTFMTTESLIPYDEIVQEALRAVIGRVLTQIAKEGLPGAHHFYIAFKTGFPGVNIPKWLKEKYPDEMTIVIQHRFWDMKIEPDHFELGLSFNQRPEHLVIPYAAVVGFVDPHVNFALQFQAQEMEDAVEQTLPQPDVSQQNTEDSSSAISGQDNVVSLDRFRKK